MQGSVGHAKKLGVYSKHKLLKDFKQGGFVIQHIF